MVSTLHLVLWGCMSKQQGWMSDARRMPLTSLPSFPDVIKDWGIVTICLILTALEATRDRTFSLEGQELGFQPTVSFATSVLIVRILGVPG